MIDGAPCVENDARAENDSWSDHRAGRNHAPRSDFDARRDDRLRMPGGEQMLAAAQEFARDLLAAGVVADRGDDGVVRDL